jgi:outer membrane protein OmpA-like peptidoglycan-associated protein/tetratricopeptide (TPR) repeat protein
MKKLYFLFLVLITSTVTIQAQSDKTVKADKLYGQLRYVDAAKAYEKLISNGERTQYVYTRLGDAYFYNSDFKNASTNYARATKTNPETETLFSYAQALKASDNYELSNTIMSQFASLAPMDDRAKAYKANPNYLISIRNMAVGFETKAMDVNGEASDFAAVRIDDKIYFSSARNNSRGNYGWNKEPYLDIYEATIDASGNAGTSTLLTGDVNTKFHEGTLDVTPDGKYMFFTRVDYLNGDYEKAADGESKLKIYRAVKAGGEWKDVQATSLENKEYGVGHPTITKDGKHIYFASEAPGGYGGSDIYRADLKDGKISNPVNLGAGINTSGDDSFPWIADNGVLYFSSNGHLGLGGLDVFTAKSQGSDFGAVSNMGAPINSSQDDFSFSYNDAAGTGFVSSNRKGGKGGDDIYAVRKIDLCEVAVTVKAVDSVTGSPIPGAILSMQSSNSTIAQAAVVANALGEAVFTSDCEVEIIARGAKDGYESGEASVAIAKAKTAMLTVSMIPDPVIVADKIILNKIYFDLDQSNIRPDAALELDRLVSLMKKYPTLEVKSETFADIRGSDSYNLALTQRRAESLVSYMVSKGIDSNRLSGEGRGEAMALNSCDTQKCTEQQYEDSRRSEFTIVKE